MGQCGSRDKQDEDWLDAARLDTDSLPVWLEHSAGPLWSVLACVRIPGLPILPGSNLPSMQTPANAAPPASSYIILLPRPQIA